MPRSEELAAPVRRAEQATATARRLRENGRLRRNAERQLDRLFELGLEFGRSGNPPPAVRTDLASKAGDALLDQDAMALPFRQVPWSPPWRAAAFHPKWRLGVVHHCHPAAALDGIEAGRAVRQQPAQEDANHARPVIKSRRAE